jgi:hypothetical protein
MVFGEKGVPKGFWEVVEGCTKLTSSQGEEHLLFTTEETRRTPAFYNGGGLLFWSNIALPLL